jgi:hypothetical protein
VAGAPRTIAFWGELFKGPGKETDLRFPSVEHVQMRLLD